MGQPPKKLNMELTTQASNPTPRYTPKRNENLCPHKNLYANVHSSMIHNSQKVETTRVPINR